MTARTSSTPSPSLDKVVGVVSKADFRGTEVERLDEETGLWEQI
jgi:hypothetical protein